MLRIQNRFVVLYDSVSAPLLDFRHHWEKRMDVDFVRISKTEHPTSVDVSRIQGIIREVEGFVMLPTKSAASLPSQNLPLGVWLKCKVALERCQKEVVIARINGRVSKESSSLILPLRVDG
ncbi:hypothetical protein AKJ16_DCAP18700 [Drosera capensis]